MQEGVWRTDPVLVCVKYKETAVNARNLCGKWTLDLVCGKYKETAVNAGIWWQTDIASIVFSVRLLC